MPRHFSVALGCMVDQLPYLPLRSYKSFLNAKNTADLALFHSQTFFSPLFSTFAISAF